MAELVIRQAEERDIAAIETLEQQCFAVPWTYESLYHDVMHNKLAFYIVAEADGVLCGYVGIWKIVDEGHITNVAVAPDYRRRHCLLYTSWSFRHMFRNLSKKVFVLTCGGGI